MYLIINSTTGQVLHAQPAEPTAASGQTVIVVTSDPLLNNCLSNPTAYWWTGSALQPWPNLSATYSGTTLTVTLNASTPPSGWTAPASVTVAVNDTTWTDTVDLTNGSGTFTLAVHPALTRVPVTATVSATATTSATVALTTGTGTPPTLQVYTPAGGNPTVAPVGPGSLLFLQNYYAGLVAAARQPGDIATADALVFDTLFGTAGILAALIKAATWTPTSAQQAAITWIQNNINANLPVTLAGSLDSSGNPIQPVAQYASDLATAAQAFAAYAADLQSIPGVE